MEEDAATVMAEGYSSRLELWEEAEPEAEEDKEEIFEEHRLVE